MSEQKWKVGDIALITGYDGPDRPAVFAASECEVHGHRWAASGHWHYLDDADYTTWTSNPAVEARSLVVIDPEDREQVERLVREMRLPVEVAAPADRLQAALREFANPTPPRPEEPVAVGALVTDHDGEMWVRHVRGEWACLHSAPGKDVRTWAELVAQYSPLKIEEPA